MPKLSCVSKLDGILSWSLPAIFTCPGARNKQGELVSICAGCYATEGNYRFKAVKAVREFNREDWKRPEWVAEMVAALQDMRYFRWFDSGDIYTVALAHKIHEVVQQTPWVNHWIPTRSHKIPKIYRVLEWIRAEKNAAVRYSSDEIDEFDPKIHGSVVVSSPDELPTGVQLCEAYTRVPAKCNGCRACWDKSVPTIGYLAHGQKMNKVIRIAKAA